MTGREIFRLLAPLFDAATFVLRLLPHVVTRALYALSGGVPGPLGIALRAPMVRRLARSCGTNVAVHEHVIVRHWGGLDLGDDVQIHPFCYLDAVGSLSIGSQVSIAHASSVLTFEHGWDDAAVAIKYNPRPEAPVSIADDVWIGCGVRVLSGARIGTRTVIAAGAVVPRGDYAGAVYAGVPAKALRRIGS